MLHSARYPRKPRGRPCRLGPEHDRRFSFCCAVEAAARATTPPSLRFLGRKVYLAAIVVLIAIMQHGATAPRMRGCRACRRRPPDRRALARVVARQLHGDAVLADRRAPRSCRRSISDRLPASLLERFAGDGAEQLIALLRFLGPITGGASAMHAR